MDKPDFNYYRTVVSTQNDPDILQSELKDLINECVAYIETEPVAEVPCSDVLSAVQSAVNRQLCDARDYYDGMQRSVDRHKNKSCDKSSLMLTQEEAIDNLNNARADVELMVKAQTFVRDKLPELIEGR